MTLVKPICRPSGTFLASRTNLPTGNAEALYDSLFGSLPRLDDALAAATLRTQGLTPTVALDGGMGAWRDAGYPIQSARVS